MIAPDETAYRGRALAPQRWRERLWALAQGLWVAAVGWGVLAVLLSR